MSDAPGTVVSYPGVMSHARQVALAFHEAGDLRAFVTTLAFHGQDAWVAWLSARRSPAAQALLRELMRRDVSDVPASRLVRYPLWEALRTMASRWRAAPPTVDRIWNRMCRNFDERVATRHVPGARRIYAYEYTARASFERARREGVETVLDLPSLDSMSGRTPPIAGDTHSGYFAGVFEHRYRRRQEEIALADKIIANSRITAASHIAAGANPAKVRVVPLAGPVPVSELRMPVPGRPLRVLCASGLRANKGATFFLDAWRGLGSASARADVFGAVDLPGGLLCDLPAGVYLHGAVPQAALFQAFDDADVLVFPTVSDGFGMVVTEALARGLPVIATDRAGAADRIESGRNGFVVPAADTAALRDALQWCLDNRLELAEMREAAWRSACAWQWADYRRALREAVAGP